MCQAITCKHTCKGFSLIAATLTSASYAKSASDRIWYLPNIHNQDSGLQKNLYFSMFLVGSFTVEKTLAFELFDILSETQTLKNDLLKTLLTAANKCYSFARKCKFLK